MTRFFPGQLTRSQADTLNRILAWAEVRMRADHNTAFRPAAEEFVPVAVTGFGSGCGAWYLGDEHFYDSAGMPAPLPNARQGLRGRERNGVRAGSGAFPFYALFRRELESAGSGALYEFDFAAAGSGGAGAGIGSGSGMGGCNGCGWLITKRGGCLRLRVKDATGICVCIDGEQEFDLFQRASDSKWYGGMFETCCGCSAVTFEILEDATRNEFFGKMVLVRRNKDCGDNPGEFTQTSYTLKNPRCCRNGAVAFDGTNDPVGGTSNCSASAVDDCGNYFTVELECIDCPKSSCCCPGCAVLDPISCVEQSVAPYAFLLDLTSAGFTGQGRLLSIPWILEIDDCSWFIECKVTSTTLKFEWIGQEPAGMNPGIGWRLTLDVSGAKAIYETVFDEFNCCDDITVSKKTSGIGGPLTLTLDPVGCGSCPGVDSLDQLQATIVNISGCGCLNGISVTLNRIPSSRIFQGDTSQSCSPDNRFSIVLDLGDTESPSGCSGFVFCGDASSSGGISFVSFDCDPFTAVFIGGEAAESLCCVGGGTFHVVITEL